MGLAGLVGLTSAAWPMFADAPLEQARARALEQRNARRYADAASTARAILRQAPLDQTALRVLMVAEQAQGRPEQAGMASTTAALASWHDPTVQMWMYEEARAGGDAADAARRADALARNRDFQAEAFGELTDLLGSGAGVRAVADRLAANPQWRADYLAMLRPRGASEANRAALLLGALSETRAPASAQELALVLAAMVSAGYPAPAWTLWQALRPEDPRLIDDPDFTKVREVDRATKISPFEWALAPATLVRLVSGQDAAGRRALAIEAENDGSRFFVSRALVVAPGRYRLTYRISGDAAAIERIRAEARCSGAKAEVETPPAAPTGGETAVAASIAVTPGCDLLTIGFSIEPGEGGTVHAAIRAVSLSRQR